ncbi:non-specific lipid transfer protein GPI-anchored 31 [Cicer arietinum]|uniref:Non-specific lipid-transfer protein-like protein At5g64080 n=1 Tax=Cicer arietinum TaxID=3827 RepID=A0A1S2XBU2_CICAR|nr:non-specific lipid-transfer protein-like protein At5g64080 [Cicer arietinum]
MASKFSFILCIFAILAVNGASPSSQNAITPSPSVDCSTIILNMADCLSFVTNDSTLAKPEGSCCSGLKTVLKTAPSCLCEAFKSSSQFGVVLNVTKALTLPSLCKVSAPSVSNCGLSETPAAAPGASLSPASSPKSAEAPGLATPVNEPALAPSHKSAASALFPISAGSFLVFLLSLFSVL